MFRAANVLGHSLTVADQSLLVPVDSQLFRVWQVPYLRFWFIICVIVRARATVPTSVPSIV
jgi:hypothetical protein